MSEGSERRSWLGAAFGMLFVFGGLAAAYSSAGVMIVGYIATANWVEVPATIHQLKLSQNHGNESTTYSVKSTYSYFYNDTRYQSDNVSISKASDNIGSYWQDLHRSLKASRSRNNATALVNPKNPSKSVLDRTLRWSAIIFGSMFLFIFSGLGGFFTWASLGKGQRRDQRLHDEKTGGIKCNEKAGSFVLAGFGSIFFVMGTGFSFLAIPQALREGEYAALLVLVFAFVGAGIMYYAFKMYRGYLRFGATPLFLDPQVPGVGAALGGKFAINKSELAHNPQTDTPLRAILTCSQKRKSGDSTSTSVLWQEEAEVYLQQTAAGVDGQFIFEIPQHCQPSKEWESRSSIDWNVAIEGEFNHPDLGKFDRSWAITVEEVAAQPGNVVNIPEAFMKKAEAKTKERAKSSAMDQIPVTEDSDFIEVLSDAGRNLGSNLFLLIFGLVFAIAGTVIIRQQELLFGLIFLAVGVSIAGAAVFTYGKALEVKIDKETNILYTRQSLFGMVYSHQQGELLDAAQLETKMTSSETSGKKHTEFYCVNFQTGGKTIRVAEGIKGRKAAEALKQLIIERSGLEGPESAAIAA